MIRPTSQLEAPPSPDHDARGEVGPAPDFEPFRRELTGYAYRMLGSPFEAEDAVQETMLRAWRSRERFQGRSSVRAWLYRITTNVCLDLLAERRRRVRPMQLGPATSADSPLPPPLEETTWLQPIPDERIVAPDADPAEIALARESIRLAFLAAIQALPPRQRAVLILRDVLRWRAAEVAQLLEMSVAAVNSALQRAHETLDRRAVSLDSAAALATAGLDGDEGALLARYVDAFERYDMDALTALLHEDATWSMPPYAMWLQTHRDIRAWCLGPGVGCRGSRLLPVEVNGSRGYAQYKPAEPGVLRPWSLQVVEVVDGRISGLTFFLDTDRLFPLFGLPGSLPA